MRDQGVLRGLDLDEAEGIVDLILLNQSKQRVVVQEFEAGSFCLPALTLSTDLVERSFLFVCKIKPNLTLARTNMAERAAGLWCHRGERRF